MKLFSVNNYTEEWSKELKKVFNSGIIGQGPKTLEFEQEFGLMPEYVETGYQRIRNRK